ncbi:MAG: protein translocase SEC61 complex subunit gamma [Candidatus Diapherotrites archaeon]
MFDIKGFFESSKRIFAVSKKPSREEFILMLKVVGIGILIIGFIGFIIRLFMVYFNIGK